MMLQNLMLTALAIVFQTEINIKCEEAKLPTSFLKGNKKESTNNETEICYVSAMHVEGKINVLCD